MHDGKFPWNYLGCPLEEILRDIDMTVDEFVKVCDRFTNKRLFLRDSTGALLKDRDGNLTKVNYDNDEVSQAGAQGVAAELTATLSAGPARPSPRGNGS